MSRSGSRKLAWCAVAATLPLVGGVLTAVPAAAANQPQGRSALHNTKPQWATARADVGKAAGATQLNLRVFLAGRDPSGLAAMAKAVSDPHSAQYGHFLTPKQYDARFGPSKQQVDALTSWLKGAGLTVTGSNEHYLSVRGSASAAQRAFGVQLHKYQVGKHTYHAPSANATVPAALSSAVTGVTGLDNAPHTMQRADTLPGPSAAYANAGPMSDYFGQKTAWSLPRVDGRKVPYIVKGYNGHQLRSAYGVKSTGLTGKGVTVAITDAFAAPTIAQDAQKYAVRNGDKPYKSGQFSQVLPSSYNSVSECGGNGWYGEETLDVEAVHAMAPDANIRYVGAASCNDNDLMDALTKIVDHHLADIVTNSWAGDESQEDPSVIPGYEQIFEQGAIEGIGFNFSTGDDGDEQAATGTKQVEFPASSPWVTAVGGTSIGIGRHGNYLFETGWGTWGAPLAKDGKSWTKLPGDFTGGAGGGTSTLFDQPFYQRGIVPNSLSEANGVGKKQRTLPDVAMEADPNTGFLVGQTQTFPDGSVKYGQYRIGGTSLSSPLFAGIQADAQQARHGRAIGFANPAIYGRYGTPMFHDVTDHPFGKTAIHEVRNDFVNSVDASDGIKTTVRTLGEDTSLHATRGYDDVTGVGTPNRAYLESFRSWWW